MTPTRQELRRAATEYDADTLWHFTLRDLGNTHTVRAYEPRIRSWVAYCQAGAHDLLKPTPGTDQGWLDSLRLSGLNSNTARQWEAAALALYRMLLREGVLFFPFQTTEPGRVVPNPRRKYTGNEKARLLKHAEAPERFALLCHMELGLRKGQILGLDWRDVREEHALYVGRARHALSARLDAALHALPTRRGRVMPYGSATRYSERMRNLGERAGVEWRGGDALRNTPLEEAA